MGANTSFLKRLTKEDFPKQYQDLVDKIGYILNPALQQIVNILNNGLTMADLNVQVKQMGIQVDTSNNVIGNATFVSTLKGQCSMMQVGRAVSVATPAVYPTGGHSITFTQNNGNITITNVTGLPPNTQFTLTIIAYV